MKKCKIIQNTCVISKKKKRRRNEREKVKEYNTKKNERILIISDVVWNFLQSCGNFIFTYFYKLFFNTIL